ncbi:haloacid dehalogenase superfamily protein, subfamily IA, variant 3 with third motif having DD or ED [Saccharomonospora marina XMU15]|uniref:Haloacid dehalogenase superfamily protein, subfamily IA, variant 3 with third motif having DD or ED n=1 Tax=Saccharomonospora marina XMU15 TaxID=882083 RepID=H5X8X9_9PSEU|nr:HAD-IA family hydrolase [Saccharomonospora marina]EHR52554.1 haloacid dehalogenase superfamily protein, subfamily IA, variant 3 with third motif having DD or ED [Saccharomonospora marina XMU15]
MLKGIVVDYAGVLTDAEGARLLAALDLARGHGMRTALLSNADGGRPVRDRLAPWFDVMVFSGEVGLAKPDVEVYRLVARRLGLTPGECAFVDDSAGNVAGAVTAGMAGVRHVSVEQTLAELAVLFAGVVPGIA